MARRSTCSFWFAGIALALAALATACKHDPAPTSDADATAPVPTSTSPFRSIRKLAGAPTRVLDAAFSEDGSQVFALERRPPKDEASREPDTFAITRRPVAGGPSVELLVTQDEIVTMTPLGNDVIVLQRPAIPKPSDDEDDDADDYYGKLEAALDKSALFRLPASGGAPIRISPDGHRCIGVVGSLSRQWIAYSLAEVEASRSAAGSVDRAARQNHMLSKSGDDLTLAFKGKVQDISDDGTRALVRRPPKPDDDDIWESLRRNDARQFVLVNVKENSQADLPASLSVDGQSIDTATLTVGFSGDGLVFVSEDGAIYRSAIDGSNAKRLAGEPSPKAPDAGAPDDAGPDDDRFSVDTPEPPPKIHRTFGPKGTLFELKEDAGSVVLSAVGSAEPLAKFEGPIAALSDIAFDAGETRVLFVSHSDTSRDGRFDWLNDDGEVFVSDQAPGPLSFDRPEIATFASELRPKIAEASMVSETSVDFIPGLRDLHVIVKLPWLDGEREKDLTERVFVEARALLPIITRKNMVLHLRMGPIDFLVSRQKDGQDQPYATLHAPGVFLVDPKATSLVLKNPVHTKLWGSSNETLSGALENIGKDPSPPIEVFSRYRQWSASPGPRKAQEVKKDLGVIEPGRKSQYQLVLVDPFGSASASFRAGGKRVVVQNEYATNHSLDWLGVALDAFGAHRAWADHGVRTSAFESAPASRVYLTREQAALPAAEREALMRKIAKVLDAHNAKFHRGDAVGVDFVDPSGGGWRLEVGKKIARYEKEDKSKKP